MPKPNSVAMITYLIKRQSDALIQLKAHQHQPGQRVYWQTIAVDAELLLGWVCDDDYWVALARQNASGLKQAVEELDRQALVPLEDVVEFTSTSSSIANDAHSRGTGNGYAVTGKATTERSAV